MTQPKLFRYALNTLPNMIFPAAVVVAGIVQRLRNGEFYEAIAMFIFGIAVGVCLLAVDLLKEASRRYGWPLELKPLEDRSDGPLAYIGKILVFAVLYLTAILLPIAGFVAATGEPWPQMTGLWFPAIILAGLLPALTWLRATYGRRRRHAQTRQAGTLTE